METQETLVAPVRARAVSEPLVLGRYRLRERLGEGGFGVVWRAEDTLLRREVAVKRIAMPGPRAEREALAAARLSHPAIVALYEAQGEGEAFYLISELVHGATLAQLLAERELSDEWVIEIGIALADALAHAHACGVIHRDVKPQNVLVPDEPGERAGVAKLTDFGGARLAGEDALTRTGDVLGTLAYMAPEQSEGREATAAVDLYALALVLYEALSGVNPVRGRTPAATARRIGTVLPALEHRRGDLERALTRALDRALDPDPERRGTLPELREALVHALTHGVEAPRGRRRGLRAARSSRPIPAVDPAGPGYELDRALAEGEPEPRTRRRLRIPRAVRVAAGTGLIAWQLASGHAGVALLVLAAALPLLAPWRLGLGFLAAALAPALGLVGLAGAYPALAGQAARWQARAALGALGYWWLCLAEPLLARRLWLGMPPGTPARGVWEGSLHTAATDVIARELSLAVLFGAALWALGAALLPWVVRGSSAALDMLAAGAWTVGLLAAPALASGVPGLSAVQSSPRGGVFGAILAAAIAVLVRALRGPARA